MLSNGSEGRVAHDDAEQVQSTLQRPWGDVNTLVWFNPADARTGRCQDTHAGPGCYESTGLFQQVAGDRGTYEIQIVDHDADLTLQLTAQSISNS
ncbi:hypothetical protein [Streptomyces sp. NPDC087297]|uniref:hypothetical protein n=1 Tax=Streptomyces sp. NPDC087297 TaxID=3365778 RepID=UPI003820838E